MAPLHSIPNMIVKRYCGENTSGEVLWENSSVPELTPDRFDYGTFGPL